MWTAPYDVASTYIVANTYNVAIFRKITPFFLGKVSLWLRRGWLSYVSDWLLLGGPPPPVPLTFWQAAVHRIRCLLNHPLLHEQYKKKYILGSKPHASGIFFVAHKLAETKWKKIGPSNSLWLVLSGQLTLLAKLTLRLSIYATFCISTANRIPCRLQLDSKCGKNSQF